MPGLSFGVRALQRLVALALLVMGLMGCGGTIYFGSSPSSSARFNAVSEPASPLPADTDAMTALSHRRMRPPTLAAGAGCPVSSAPAPGAYGVGFGPAYLSGPDGGWYSGGQIAILTVDSRYSGPLLVRGFQLSGEGISTVTLADAPTTLPSPVDKERSNGVAVVPAVHTAQGGVFLQAAVPSSFSRAWFGWLTTDSPGCFGLQVDGDVFTEFIVFSVRAGTPPQP
jgi:hypothetical protein